MTIYLIQHAFQGASGLAEDRYINTFHGASVPLNEPPDFASVAAAIKRFYVPTTGTGIANAMSDRATGAGRTIKIYDLSQAKPRVPVYEETEPGWVLSPNNVQSYPEEVALCLSYQGDAIPGSPQARRRGRIYLGPFNIAASSAVAGAEPRPLASLRTTVLAAAEILADELLAADCPWIVYSPTNDPAGTGAVGAGALITNCWVDDAWDTQRRRGVAPSSRSTRVFT